MRADTRSLAVPLNVYVTFWPRTVLPHAAGAAPSVSALTTSAGTSQASTVAVPTTSLLGSTRIVYVPAAGRVSGSTKITEPLPLQQLLNSVLPSGFSTL